MKITPHHKNNFPLIPKHTLGLEIMEHIRRRGRSHQTGNRHHLFFDKEQFKHDPVLHALRENPFCIVILPFPWHVLLHQRHNRSPVPDREVALGFLDEAAVIERWVRRLRLAHDVVAGKGADSTRAQEKREELMQLAGADSLQLTATEIMPVDMRLQVISGITKMGLDAAPLHASLPADPGRHLTMHPIQVPLISPLSMDGSF